MIQWQITSAYYNNDPTKARDLGNEGWEPFAVYDGQMFFKRSVPESPTKLTGSMAAEAATKMH